MIKRADILIVRFCPISGDLIKSAPCLKLIATLRTSTSNIDKEAAKGGGEACDRLVNKYGNEKIFDMTGMPAHPMATAIKIAWLLIILKVLRKPVSILKI